jgi:hypothetical protein
MILGFLPFYGLVAAGAVRLRRRHPIAAGQYAMPLYPLPVAGLLLYVLCGLLTGFLGDPVAAAGGVIILAVGAGAFELWRRTGARRKLPSPEPPRSNP